MQLTRWRVEDPNEPIHHTIIQSTESSHELAVRLVNCMNYEYILVLCGDDLALVEWNDAGVPAFTHGCGPADLISVNRKVDAIGDYRMLLVVVRPPPETVNLKLLESLYQKVEFSVTVLQTRQMDPNRIEQYPKFLWNSHWWIPTQWNTEIYPLRCYHWYDAENHGDLDRVLRGIGEQLQDVPYVHMGSNGVDHYVKFRHSSRTRLSLPRDLVRFQRAHTQRAKQSKMSDTQQQQQAINQANQQAAQQAHQLAMDQAHQAHQQAQQAHQLFVQQSNMMHQQAMQNFQQMNNMSNHW